MTPGHAGPLTGKMQGWSNASNTVSKNGQGPLIYGLGEKWPYYAVHKAFMNMYDQPNDTRAC